MQDLSIERYGFTLFNLIFCAFLTMTVGTMIGEWAITDIGVLDLAEINCLAARTGFAVVFAGSMLYLVLLLTGEGRFPLPSAIAWHGLELLITAVIGLVLVVYGLDGIMPWYRLDAPIFAPLSLFAGLLSGWAFRFFAKQRLTPE